jgi:hypothetical protein
VLLKPIYIFRRDVNENKDTKKPGTAKDSPTLRRPLSTIEEEPNKRQKRAASPQKPQVSGPKPDGQGNNHPGNNGKSQNNHPGNNGKPQNNHPANNGKSQNNHPANNGKH